MQNHELGQSKEDYLEAIAVVRQRNGACRLTDVRTRGMSAPRSGRWC